MFWLYDPYRALKISKYNYYGNVDLSISRRNMSAFYSNNIDQDYVKLFETEVHLWLSV